LHWTLATHHSYTLWVLSNKLWKLQKLQLTIYTMQLITIQLQFCHNNFFQLCKLPYDYNHNVTLMSFSSIHQNLTCGTMRIVCDSFEILISIIHYDYSFDMVLDYDMWHNPKLPHDILIEFWKQIYICIST